MTKAAELAKMGEVLTNSKIGGRRNIIINGGCKVNQRGSNGSSKTSGGDYATDRFKTSLNGIGTWTIENVTDSPSEFSNSHKLTCTSADGSISADDFAFCRYIIEARDLQQLGFGTSDAKPFTLSFYVKSNKTGNATVEINQQDASPIRRVALQYTINQADTWERKTLTVTGDTSGTINDDNGGGFEIYWWLRSGSTYIGGSHATTFADINGNQRNASNLDVGATNNDTWQITGVQLEVGSQATPFEHRSFGEERQLCYRYYYRTPDRVAGGLGVNEAYPCFGNMDGTSTGAFIFIFPVPMRAAPTSFEQSGTASHYSVRVTGDQNGTSVPTATGFTSEKALVNLATGGGFTSGDGAFMRSENDDGFIAFSAEL